MTIEFEEYKNKILDALKNKCDSTKGCRICNEPNLTLIDGFINQPISKQVSGSIVVGGPTMPLIATACKNCGNVQYFALKALLPDD